jgi:hypothetical protein
MANYVRVGPFVDGTSPFLSAANMNLIDLGILAAHFQPAARVFHNAAQSTTTAVAFVLAFNSERFDTDTIHDTSTNNSRLTCKTAGKYQITANVDWVGNATGYRQIYLRLNGATIIASAIDPQLGAGINTHQSVTTLYDLAVNDYVEAVVIQTSGGSLNVNSTANYSPEFMMARIA